MELIIIVICNVFMVYFVLAGVADYYYIINIIIIIITNLMTKNLRKKSKDLLCLQGNRAAREKRREKVKKIR